MTITELIKELEACREKHGDVQVKVNDSGSVFNASARGIEEGTFDIQNGALFL